MLNRFGNCISYQHAQRYVATVAEANDEQTIADGFFIPSNLKHGRFTQCAIDNLDFHESTKDGTTMHGTTQVIYQYPISDDLMLSTSTVPLQKSRKAALRTSDKFAPLESRLTLKDRQKSRSLCGKKLLSQCSEKPMEFHLNTLWHMIGTEAIQSEHMGNPLTHMTWNAFNKFFIEELVLATVIGYGPFFPQSPTCPDVVQSSVEYCMKVANKLGQEHCVLTCDQAIYEIVLVLKNKNPDRYKSLILRMGGFHIACNFMGAIGHLMKFSGIEDILVEATVYGSGTANKIMAGKDYYTMLRAHSLILAAFFELHWSSFHQWLIYKAGLWDEHLTEVENMMPYMVAAGHHKYVSCLPHYLKSMKQLPTTAPYVYEAFKRGNFNVHQTQGNFNGVWSDMALEQNCNCDAKTRLFNGITQTPQTIDKYLKALPVMTSVLEQVKTMVHMNQCNS